MSTYSDVPSSWSQGYKGHRESWTAGQGVRAQATWIGPWVDRVAMLEVIGGTEEVISYPGGISTTRIVPLKYPVYEDVYAEHVEMEPLGRPAAHSTELMSYDRPRSCRITVHFASRPWNVFGSDYPLVDFTATSGKKKVTRPGTAYIFPSDSHRLAGNVGVDVAILNFQMTFHNLANMNLALYTSVTNLVNSVPFQTPYGTMLAGHVMYLGFSNQESLSLGGIYQHRITHSFRYEAIPHNQIMRFDGTAFEAPVDDNGNMIYSGYDLNELYGTAA